jgi:hypothetical protein
MKEMETKRYNIRAKRKDKDEPWTEWTCVDNYQDAIKHMVKIEELGFKSKIIPSDEVRALWEILGGHETEKTDAILDAGFRKQDDAVRDIILEIDELLCCHANGSVSDERLYRVFDKLKKKYLEPKCPDCKHFVGCECFDGRTCDKFEIAEG